MFNLVLEFLVFSYVATPASNISMGKWVARALKYNLLASQTQNKCHDTHLFINIPLKWQPNHQTLDIVIVTKKIYR